jgi:hypothetical protein
MGVELDGWQTRLLASAAVSLSSHLELLLSLGGGLDADYIQPRPATALVVVDASRWSMTPMARGSLGLRGRWGRFALEIGTGVDVDLRPPTYYVDGPPSAPGPIAVLTPWTARPTLGVGLGFSL